VSLANNGMSKLFKRIDRKVLTILLVPPSSYKIKDLLTINILLF